MSGKPPLWYVDTCVFVSLVSQEEVILDDLPRWRWSQLLFERAERGEIELATSAYTLAELNGGRGQTSREVLDEISAIFDSDHILPINLSVDIALLARELIWRFRRGKPKRELHSADAIHLASSIAAGCAKLITWDDQDLIKLDPLIAEITITSLNRTVSEQQAQLDL